MSLDACWLRAPGRRFPVQLDPTMVIIMGVDVPFNAASFTASGPDYPVTGDRLLIGGDAFENRRAAVLFGLENVPADARVSDASLGLYYDRICVTATTACGSTSQLMTCTR